jgi:two-component system, chemotaxis family, sensor kinase CheA
MMNLAEKTGMSASTSGQEALSKTSAPIIREEQVLLFNLNPNDLYGIPMPMIERLEQIKYKAIEHVNERWFLRYRGTVLPLASGWSFLQDASTASIPQECHVVVVKRGQQEVGFVVRDIVDVVPMEGPIVNELHDEPHLLGSAILQKKIVSIVNLPFIAQECLGEVKSPLARENVLIWENSPEMASRASSLREQGYSVTEAHSREEAEEVIRSINVDVVITESSIDETDRNKLNASLAQKYGDQKKVEVVSLSEEDAWQPHLNSDQLSEVLSDILKANLGS